jgi:uncharacterized membrane protein
MPRGIWWIVETAAFAAFVSTGVLVINYWHALPAEIPTHFNAVGRPDAYGDKSTLFLLVFVAIVVYSMLTAAPFFPAAINVIGDRTPAKIRAAIAMLRLIKLETMGMFVYIVWTMIQVGMGEASWLGAWMLPVALGVFLVTVVGGLIYSTRYAR